MADSSKKLPDPKFVPDSSKTSSRVYANFASVRTQGIDFTISFADVLPPTKEEVEMAKRGQEIAVPLQCEVVIPNSMVIPLIEALRKQYELIEQKKSEKKSVASLAKAKS